MYDDFDWRYEPPKKLEAKPITDSLHSAVMDYTLTVSESQKMSDLAAWTMSTIADTLFLHSVMVGDIPMIRKLAEAGCNLNAYDRWGRFAMHLAPSDEVAFALIGISAHHRCLDGIFRTPLHYAAMRNMSRTILWILKQDEDVDDEDAYGNTPLHLAAETGSIDAAKCLIENEADPYLENERGDTPGEIFKREHGYTLEICDEDRLNSRIIPAVKYDGNLFDIDGEQ